jgi:hypothetical protein
MLDSLISFITVLLALSIASERLVELIKGFFASLNGRKPDTDGERTRHLSVHWLSLVASVIVVVLMQDYICQSFNLDSLGWLQGAALSILASGGSSMWNSILSYALNLKYQQQQTLTTKQSVGNADLAKGLPASMPQL